MQVFHASLAHQIHLARLEGAALAAGAEAGGIHRAGQLLTIPDLPLPVRAFLVALAPDHRVKLHQRGTATPAGALLYIDPSCRPDEVDPDHFAADDPGACYVVKAGRLTEAVATDYVAEMAKVRYVDGRTELVYQAQVHESRLTAAWDVMDWQAKRVEGGAR